MKVTYNIIKSETDRKSSNNAVHYLIIDEKLKNNHMIGNSVPVFQQWPIN
jgi:hypothetical protein